jgi:hypothetical protein
MQSNCYTHKVCFFFFFFFVSPFSYFEDRVSLFAGMTEAPLHPVFCFVLFFEMGSRKLFYPDWPGTVILQISASREAWDDKVCATMPSCLLK